MRNCPCHAVLICSEKAKRHASQNAGQLYDSHYGGQDQYDPNYQPPREVQDCTSP
jgi:hypothetical protein